MAALAGNKNQREIVIDHLLTSGSITSIEAFEKYNITRISAVIHLLRNKDKIAIKMDREKYVGPDGVKKTFGRFSLAPATAAKP
ncbi:helix-turn-helix domain-containing protein [Methylobacillus sp.]|uniref:helix-turn-helix domain-containing protein n=1 Tax=Methylobacillus sp. TaxID=56818 RepID=UPI0012C1AE96|nr:helix-turn-helix domain-containing protein [Methylobacillus sp.]MPS48473.1 hypothetical protein [Methylobacillus sp.]